MSTAANNLAQARVVDPILTQHAIGYRNSEFIGEKLFPNVPVLARGAKVIRFGKEAFRKLNSKRAPGANVIRIKYGYESDVVSVNSHDLQAPVPVEEMEDGSLVPGFDLAATNIEIVLDSIELEAEIEKAGLATNPDNYLANNKTALSGAQMWDQSGSTPLADIKDAKQAIRRQIGRKPNRLILGSHVFDSLCSHAAVRDHFKYTSNDSITTEMLARYFQVDDVVIGEGVYLPADASDSDDALDIWPNVAVLAYVSTGTNYKVPSFGYNYRINSNAMVQKPFYDPNSLSWIYGVHSEYRPYITAPGAGFLFSNVIGG